MTHPIFSLSRVCTRLAPLLVLQRDMQISVMSEVVAIAEKR